VARAWDLTVLSQAYGEFVSLYSPLLDYARDNSVACH